MTSILILFGSQTGNATEIAKLIQTDLVEHLTVKPRLQCMKDYVVSHKNSIDDLKNEQVVILICSTTGSGDAPDNANKFWRLLRKKKDKDWLSGVKYCVLGLGDTNYDNFCKMGKSLDRKFKNLGAQQFYRTGLADDGVGLELVVEPWRKELVSAAKAVSEDSHCRDDEAAPAPPPGAEKKEEPVPSRPKGIPKLRPLKTEVKFLHSAVASPSLLSLRVPVKEKSSELHGYVPDAPFLVRIAEATCLTKPGAQKHVLHVGFEFPERSSDNVLYSPGDALGIYCPNDADEVDALLDRLQLTPQADVPYQRLHLSDEVKSAVPLRQADKLLTPRLALIHQYDITSTPKKSLLRVLAEYCTSPEDERLLLHLCSVAGRNQYQREIVEPRCSLLELLRRVPSCQPPYAHLTEHLTPLTPRYYSAAADQGSHPHMFYAAFSLVRFNNPSGPRHGLCTHWLYSLCRKVGLLDEEHEVCGVKPLELPANPSRSGYIRRGCDVFVPAFLRRSRGFSLPSDVSRPIVMIGPGTGVAPFRGFLQKRRQLNQAVKSGGACLGSWRGMDLENIDDEEDVEDECNAKVPAATPPGSAPSTPSGTTHLFFGCRRRDLDYLYGEEFEAFVEDGTLTELTVAFSQEDPEKKVYVQHKLLEQGKEIAGLIVDQQAYVFVCGDGANMAKAVNEALKSILAEHTDMDAASAQSYLFKIMREKRYVQDVWS